MTELDASPAVTRPVREIRTKKKTPEDDWPLIEIGLDDFTLRGRCPKSALVTRAQAVVSDKYASDTLVTRTAFEFLEATLEADSWVHIRGRILDRDDDFDEEELAEVFNAVFDTIKEQAKEREVAQAPNRAAKRAAARG